MKVSVGIAAFREPLISDCLRAVLKEGPDEVIVVTPDEGTFLAVKEFKGVKLIKELRREGKPSAVNKILKSVKGDIIVLTDADLIIDKGAIKELIKPFSDSRVSVVCARPVVIPQGGMMGFWGSVLYDIVHKQRLNGVKHLTTNLCAFRKGCVNEIPKDSLVDDYVIGLECLKKGGFVYAPKARVNVKFPSSISDFLKQRRRTFAGYMQVSDWYGSSDRSLNQEVKGVSNVFSYIKRPIHLIWVLSLAFFRLIAWLLAFWDYRVKRKDLKTIWVPANSTKN